MSVDIDGLLKAEIHCHIEGAAHPELVQRLARKHGLDVSDAIENNRYVWSDFTSFLNCYDKASRVFREPEDYRLLTYDCYSRMAEQKAIYGEVFASPDHAAELGIGYVDLIEAMAAGIEDARAEFGIEGNPFGWMSETMDLSKEKNFFETRVTEYQTGGALVW